MSVVQDVKREHNVHTAAAKILEFETTLADGVTPIEATFPMSWMLKRNKLDPDGAAKLTKTVGSGITISGTFNVNPALNTQLVEVFLSRTDTASLSASVTYWHELKRTDVESVLAEGSFVVKQAVHR